VAKKHDETRLPPMAANVEDIMKALLRTPPPPAGDPSTQKKKPAKKRAVKPKVTK
jgi:hypothetical protein